MPEMTSHELRAALTRLIGQATGAISGGDISTERAELFERYMGEPYGDEVEDRSGVVSTDISDTIEWIMPELMEIFTAGDKVATFEPEGPEDEEAAEQETETVNYVFYRQNDGFMALYSFIKDGLVQKNGYMKRHWSTKEKVSTEEYSGLTEWEWASMQARWAQQGWEVEVLREERAEAALATDGAMLPTDDLGPEIDVEVQLTRIEEKMVVESVPPEEVLVSPRWNRVDLDGCPFVAHRRTLMVSDLVEMGYDPEQAKRLPSAFDDEWAEEKVERWALRNASEYDDREEMDESTREVMVHECYVYVDYDGDDKAELRRVMVGGNGHTILEFTDGTEDNEEVETQPFSAWTPVPIPHRHYGRSIAELVKDLQRIKTVLFRQMLDNIYLTNNPTREISQDGIIEGVTLQDLLHERPGKVLRTAMTGNYTEHAPPPFMNNLMPAIEYVDTVRENRTGVTRYNQGLDADSLNKTAHGIERVMSASMRKLALYARICAETGLRHLFRGIHGDLRRNASKEMTLRLRNQYVPVDPRSWAERADMTVNIGTGTADKQMKMSFLERIIAEVKEHLADGSPLAGPAHLYNAYERYVENAGFKNAEEFFANPMKQDGQSQAQLQQGAQDGGEAQAYLQAEQMKTQQREQNDLRDHQLDLYKARLEDDRERDKANLEAALKLVEINAKNGTQLTIEQIKAAAQSASQVNQPPGNGQGT